MQANVRNGAAVSSVLGHWELQWSDVAQSVWWKQSLTWMEPDEGESSYFLLFLLSRLYFTVDTVCQQYWQSQLIGGRQVQGTHMQCQFGTTTLTQKSHRAPENKGEETLYNVQSSKPIILSYRVFSPSLSHSSCKFNFANTCFNKRFISEVNVWTPIMLTQQQQNTATVGTVPLIGKLSWKAQSEEGPPSCRNRHHCLQTELPSPRQPG